MRILVIGGYAPSLIKFRGALLRTLTLAGHDIIVAANGHDSATEQVLREMSVKYHAIRLVRSGMNPVRDLITLIDIFWLLRRTRPDIMLSYTIKPVIYGNLAAQLVGIPAIYSLITGLGYVFVKSNSISRRALSLLVKYLYRLALRKSSYVFFQNPDNIAFFIRQRLIKPYQAVLVNGSGVDIDHFNFSPVPDEPIFLMIARLLADKGVREYVAAATIIKRRFPKTRFLLVGPFDLNPSSIRNNEVQDWQEARTIEYFGYIEDVRPILASCRAFILPSYHEGMPHSVLEAMAIGRPIITCDSVGCRETIRLTDKGKRQKAEGESVMEGENGFLVKVKDVNALVHALEILLEQPDLAGRLSLVSRQLAEQKYNVHLVNAMILEKMGLSSECSATQRRALIPTGR